MQYMLLFISVHLNRAVVKHLDTHIHNMSLIFLLDTISLFCPVFISVSKEFSGKCNT